MRHLFFAGLLAGVGLCFAQAQTVPEADVQTLSLDDLIEDFGYSPHVPIGEGVKRFVEWYMDFYGGRNE